MPDAADDIVNVEGYNLIRKDRGSRAGGVALYIRSHIQFTLLDIPLEYASPVEFLVVKVRLKKTISAFGAFYRPPKCSHPLRLFLVMLSITFVCATLKLLYLWVTLMWIC